MSHELIFTILPFDPRATQETEIRLPVDLDDLASQLRDKWPDAEVKVFSGEQGVIIRLYISTKQEGLWDVAGYSEDHDQFYVNGWPKTLAKEIIQWYRRFIPQQFRLFLVTPENDYTVELTEQTSLDDIETFYPYMVPDDE